MNAAYELEGLIRQGRFIARATCEECSGSGYGYEPCDQEAYPCPCGRAVDVLSNSQTYFRPDGRFKCWICREVIDADWTRCIGLRVHWACARESGYQPDLLAFPRLYEDMKVYDLEAALMREATTAVAS